MKIARVLIAALLCGLLISCGGGGGGGNNDPAAPVTVAQPPGGDYAPPLSVTLTSDKPGTIYYTLDGSDPIPGQAGVLSGPSPVENLPITETPTVLKFCAVGLDGAAEQVKSETYTLKPPPAVSIQPVSPIGLLDTVTARWESDRAGAYTIELGGTGAPGSGAVLAQSTVAAAQVVEVTVPGTSLSFLNETPLWVFVTDDEGQTGSSSTSLGLKGLSRMELVRDALDFRITPDGQSLYVACGGSLMKVSGGNQTVVLEGLGGGMSVAITPDGSFVYVSDSEGVSILETATDTVVATILQGNPVGGIGFLPDGSRAYAPVWGTGIAEIDTDPDSASYLQVLGYVFPPHGTYLTGRVEVAPNGKLAALKWVGGLNVGTIEFFVTDPADPLHNSYLNELSGPWAGISDTAFTPDSQYAFTRTNSDLEIGRIDLSNGQVDAAGSGYPLALTPDGDHLLTASGNVLSVVDPVTLETGGRLQLMEEPGSGLYCMRVAPDGSRAYLTGYAGLETPVLITVPLR